MGSFQDAIPRNHCFGCGPLNPDGLHIQSTWVEDVAALEHMAGPTHVLNGGIIATIFDCHGICTAIADAYDREGRPIGGGADIWYATGDLRVRYLAPTPLGPELELRAWIEDVDGRKTTLRSVLVCEGEARAAADVLAVRVPEAWRHGAEHAPGRGGTAS